MKPEEQTRRVAAAREALIDETDYTGFMRRSEVATILLAAADRAVPVISEAYMVMREAFHNAIVTFWKREATTAQRVRGPLVTDTPASDRRKQEAVAACLARMDDKFIGATDWAGELGNEYRAKAQRVLLTLDNVDAGIRSGGLP